MLLKKLHNKTPKIIFIHNGNLFFIFQYFILESYSIMSVKYDFLRIYDLVLNLKITKNKTIYEHSNVRYILIIRY